MLRISVAGGRHLPILSLSEEGNTPNTLFYPTQLLLVLTVMTGVFAIGLTFLIEMKTKDIFPTLYFDITVKAGKSSPSQWPDKALLAIFLVLKNVSQPAHESGSIVGLRGEGKAHKH
jgi:hypothetical protein